MTGYVGHSDSRSLLIKNRDKLLAQDEINIENHKLMVKEKLNGSNFPKLDFNINGDFPIKILDSMIQVEEDIKDGFSVYNRGKKLK